MAHDSPARSPGDPGQADLDDDQDYALDAEQDEDGVRERLFPRAPVARRTLLVSASLAGIGLIALIVAVAFAVSHMGPRDQPLLITPLGLGEPAGPGEPAAAPQQGGKVPDVVGMTFTRASSLLERAGFRVQARYEQGNQPRDTVISQDPAPGSQLGRRGVVTLAVSAGIVEDPANLPATPTTVAAPTTTRRATATTRRPPATTSKPPTTPPTNPPTTPPPTTPPTTLPGG
jgi:PASTA domain